MLYGYIRCSTNEARQDVERQIRELKKSGVQEPDMFIEYESGIKADRIQLNRLLATVKPKDIIVTTEVSRLTRSTKQLCEILEFAKEKELKLIIGTLIVDCRNELDPMTDGMLKMMGVFAEMERNIISQRVKSGIENARAKGMVIGRPATSLENLPQAFLRHYPLYESKKITLTALARICDISRQTTYKYIKIYKQAISIK